MASVPRMYVALFPDAALLSEKTVTARALRHTVALTQSRSSLLRAMLRETILQAIAVCAACLLCLAGAAQAQTIASTNFANQVTLQLTSNTTGTGYFTLLTGASAICGSAAQTRAGQDGTGATAFRIGSLPLTAGIAGNYTVRNLTASTGYTVCFTPDGTTSPAQKSMTTSASVALSPGAWTNTGAAGFSAGTAAYESLSVAPNGTPYVAYEDGGNGNRATVMAFNGTSWGTVGTGLSAGTATYESLTFAPDGTPYVAYSDGGNNNRATVMAFHGTYWSTVGAAGFSADEALYESLSFAPDGTPYLAYFDNSNSGRVTVMKFNGTFWAVVGAAGFSSGAALYESLSFAPNGMPYVAYEDTGHSNRATAMAFNGTSWTTVGAAGFSAGTAMYESLSFAPNGTPYVAYEDGGNGNRATVMAFNGTSWTTVGAAGFSAGAALYESLSYGADGAPYLAYFDDGNGDRATVMKYGGSSWAVVGTAGFSSAAALYESLTFGPNGTPYVAYQDAGNNDKATVMKLVAVPAAATGSATSVTVTTATLNGTVNDDGAATTIAFQYGLTTNYSTMVTATNPAYGNLAAGSGSTAASVGLTYLAASTPYHYRIAATANGVTVYGNDAMFTTPTLPTVTNVSPSSGPAAGGTMVTITGTNFTNVMAVSFGSTPAASYVLNGASSITAVSPPGSGTVDVQVLTAAGSSATGAADQFSYQSLGAISTANLGANQVTLQLTSSATGTGYFTLLAGANAICGSAAQTKAGLGSTGTAAFRIGSLPLTAGTAGSYTVRNLTANTAYTVCFTQDGTMSPSTANLTTNAAAVLGSAWTTVGAAGFSAGYSLYQSMAFAPSGTPYVAYADGSNSTFQATVMKYNGSSWVLVGAADFSSAATNYESLAFAPDGTPYLAYLDYGPSGNSLAATVMKYNGTAWVLVGPARFTPGEAFYESLAFGPDGTPYLAYYDDANSDRASVMKFNGSSWVQVGAAGFTPGEAEYESLAFGPDGTPYVAYLDQNASGAASAMKFNGTSWVQVGATGFSAGATENESLAFSPNGTPYLAYLDTANSNGATVMKFNGTSWVQVGAANFSNGAAYAESLAFGPDGTPYVAYEDGKNNSMATVMRYSGSAWALAGTADFSSGEADYTSLAFGPDGTPYVAYSDYNSGGLATVKKLNSTVAAPSAMTGVATSVTSASATLNGTVNDGGTNTTITFQYGTSTSYGTTVTATTPAGGSLAAGSGSTAASVGITGLAANMLYHFRIVATGNGMTVYGNDAMFMTQAPVSPTMLTGQAGVAFSYSVTPPSGNGPYSYQIIAGSLPAGLSLGGASGIISGTPTVVGSNFPVTVQMTNTTNSATTSTSYLITILAPVIVVNPVTLPTLTFGVTPPPINFTASGGMPAYSFSLGATSLPAGLTLNGSSGVVMGTPTMAGPYSFTVTATDSTTGTGMPFTGSQMYSGTVAKANTTTMLATPSSQTPPVGSIVLTATVASVTTGTPTGNVAFYDGMTLLGTVPLGNGQAQFTVQASTLPAGTQQSFSAQYAGDGLDFNPSSSGPVLVSVLPNDFTFTLNPGQIFLVQPGQSLGVTFQVTPVYTLYPGTVTFTVAGLPAGATPVFVPSSIPANGGPQTLTMNVTTVLAFNHRPGIGRRDLAPIAFGLLLLPLAGLRISRRKMRSLTMMFLLMAGLVTAAGISGCGVPDGFFAQAPQTYPITVTATAGTISHAAGFNLTVQ